MNLLDNVNALYVGAQPIEKIQLGSEHVWSRLARLVHVLFGSGEGGGLWLPGPGQTFTDEAGTTGAVATNAAARNNDQSPNAAHALQSSPDARPALGRTVPGGRRNLLLSTDTLATQSVTVTAVSHVLSFTGTGTVTLSGASTAGPLVGTGAGNRVSLTFTPSAASLTLTVTGSVTLAQLETAATATTYQKVGASALDVTEAGKREVWYLRDDLIDDSITATFSEALGADCTIIFSTGESSVVTQTGQTVGTTYDILQSDRIYGMVVVDRALTATEAEQAREFLAQQWLPEIAHFTWDGITESPASNARTTMPSYVMDNLYNKIRGCTLNADGTVNYYLSATDWAFKEDGVTASVLTGADGNVMVEIPKFYYRVVRVGTEITWQISPNPVADFALHPAFILDGAEVNHRYYGAYSACVYDDSAAAYISGTNLDNNTANVATADDKLSSVKGIYPMGGLTRNEFRLMAANNGTGWRQLDFPLWSAVGMLYLVEYQTFYNQEQLGNGNTNNSYLASSADQNDSPHTIAGYRDDVGNGSTDATNGQGTATRPGTVAMKYRGIENLFGNTWSWADGIGVNFVATGNVHIANDNNRANYNDTVENHTLVSSALTTGDGNIQSLLPLDPYFLAASVGGTAAQYVTDRHFGSAVASRMVRVGGGADRAGEAGVFASNLNQGTLGRLRVIGGRLAR